MKKTYLARRNGLFTLTGLSWGARALFFVLVMLLVRLLAPNFFWQITAPIFYVSNALASANHSFLSTFSNATALSAENEVLRRQNDALAAENAALAKQVMNLGPMTERPPGILAPVVARPPESPYDTLVLAQGTRAGVAVGMQAFSTTGVPLGIVADVSPDFSRVVLFSASGVSTAGWVGKANTPVSVIGTGGGTLEVVLSRSAGIVEGNMLYVSGPGMLPLGVVARVDSDPSSPSVTLRIAPLSNVFSLGLVELRRTGTKGTSTLFVATSTQP